MRRLFYNLRFLFSLLIHYDLGFMVNEMADSLKLLEEKNRNLQEGITTLSEEITRLEEKLTLYETAAKEVNTMMKKSPRLARGARIKS